MQPKYIVNKKIDYITLSCEKAPTDIIGDFTEELKYSPLKNYNKAYKTSTGAIVCIHTERSDMRTHIIMSGETLDYIRSDCHTDLQLAKFFIGMKNVKFGRVDICVTSVREDNKPHNLDPHYLAVLSKRGYLKSALKPDNGVINDGMYIETHYIGSRLARNRLFKAYDKGIDLGLTAKTIIRYELETRKRSNLIINAIVEKHDIGAIIRRYVDFPENALWVEIMGADPSVIPQIEDTRSKETKDTIDRANRWHWLLTSVAPAMGKALFYDKKANGQEYADNENMRLFSIRVSQIIESLENAD